MYSSGKTASISSRDVGVRRLSGPRLCCLFFEIELANARLELRGLSFLAVGLQSVNAMQRPIRPHPLTPYDLKLKN